MPYDPLRELSALEFYIFPNIGCPSVDLCSGKSVDEMPHKGCPLRTVMCCANIDLGILCRVGGGALTQMIIGMQVQDSKVSKTINHMPEKPAHAAIKGIISFHGAFQEFNGQLLFPYLHTPGVFGALVNSLVPGPVHIGFKAGNVYYHPAC